MNPFIVFLSIWAPLFIIVGGIGAAIFGDWLAKKDGFK